MDYIYISTDSNEVKVIMENQIPFKMVKHYSLSKDSIRLNRKSNTIINLPSKIGENIKKMSNLSFNPMSIILGKMRKREEGILVKKLIEQALFVEIRETNGQRARHYFPNKYQGFQGGLRR